MDLIERQAAIDAVETIGFDFSDSGLSAAEIEEVCEAIGEVRQAWSLRIKRLPSAQPERKIGEWIKVDPHIVVCPFCKHASSPKNFCADCGADLRGGNNE